MTNHAIVIVLLETETTDNSSGMGTSKSKVSCWWFQPIKQKIWIGHAIIGAYLAAWWLDKIPRNPLHHLGSWIAIIRHCIEQSVAQAKCQPLNTTEFYNRRPLSSQLWNRRLIQKAQQEIRQRMTTPEKRGIASRNRDLTYQAIVHSVQDHDCKAWISFVVRKIRAVLQDHKTTKDRFGHRHRCLTL